MKDFIAFILITTLTLTLGPSVFAKEIYTGLIVDARELKVEPSKSPKIYDENGIEIYGTVNIDPDFVIEKGIVQYTRTISEAIREEIAGENPIVVRAISRGPHPYKADVTISVEDAAWILKANKKSHFLENLNVVFVIER